MIKAASLDINVNLKGFSDQLHRMGLVHRIIEESGQQVIWVQSEREAELLQQVLVQWLESEQLQTTSDSPLINSASVPPVGDLVNRVWHGLYRSPITWILIVISATVAFISQLGSDTNAVRSLFYPLLPTTDLLALLGAINSPAVLLNTLTPMFLHFGELHIVFNMLWLWYFGKQLESLQSPWMFLVLVIATAFVSNTAQYLVQEFNNFGGMSGVVYGLVGYTWVIHFFMPRSHLLINNSMFVFFVIALVLMEVFASSWIASAAHAAGLLAGLLVGAIVVLIYRFVLGRQVIGYNRFPSD